MAGERRLLYVRYGEPDAGGLMPFYAPFPSHVHSFTLPLVPILAAFPALCCQPLMGAGGWDEE